MKNILLTATLIMVANGLMAQLKVKTYGNGFIYTKSAMSKLGKIVDSLNLRYKSCDQNTVFYSKAQVTGHIVRLDTGDVKQAKKDLDNHLSFEQFIAKYPLAKIKENVLIVKYSSTNYKGKEVIEFAEVDPGSNYTLSLEDKEHELHDLRNTWLYDYREQTSYSGESIRAFFFTDTLSSRPIKTSYARMIGYSDCLMDTFSIQLPSENDTNFFRTVDLPRNWAKLSEDKKKQLLDEFRGITIIGSCSRDDRPVRHAMCIALLSAETINWEIFLRSHLDIINDRFDRVAESSVARASRKTYIRELEALDINVPDLLLGIVLRIENPSKNHYYGSIDRLGKAIAESKNRPELEKVILSMIEDNELDTYNRVLAFCLFRNYNYFIEDKAEQKAGKARLLASVQKLPEYISKRIDLKEE